LIDYIKNIRKKVGHDRIIIVGAGVLIYKDNMVLLQKRKDDLTWSTHGGSVDLGENVEEAARRELKEETGLVAGKLDLLGVFSGKHLMHTYPNGDKVYIIEVNYACNDFSGDLLPDPDEVLELKWFDLNDLPKVKNKAFNDRMNDFINYLNKK